MSPALRGNGPFQEDFSGGMVRDIAPELIPENAAYDLVNVCLDEEGHPYRRGGTAYKSKILPSAAPILDNFNRANENPVSKGGEWGGALEKTGVNLQVQSNRLVPSGFFLGSAVFKKTVEDGSSYVTLVELGDLANAVWIRTAGEGDASTLRGYYFGINEETSGRWALSLVRVDPGGGQHQIALKPHQRLVDGDSLAIMAIGSNISAWRLPSGGEWTRVLAGEDSTYTSGRIGVTTFSGKLDDFGGGTITPFSDSGLTWNWDGYLLPGQRSLFADDANFGVLDTSDVPVNLGGNGLSVPKQSAALEDLLFIGGGTIYGGSRQTAPYSTGTIKVEAGSKVVKGSGTTWNTLVDAGMLMQIGSERVYVVAAINSTTELTLRDAYEGTGGSGKSYTLNPIYTVGSDPYETWDYLCVCANRLVLLNGRTVKYTEPDDPHTFTNSLGTTNEHTLPEGVEGRGVATVGETVLIFTTAGIWVLDGLALDIVDQSGNPQHRLQQLSSDIALAGATGIAGSQQRLVVPAEDGIYLMDGISQPVRISRPIDRLYREQIAAGYKLGKAEVYRGHYLLPIITGSGAVRKLFVCLLDRPTRSRGLTVFPWSRFTGDGGEITSFAVHTPVSGEPLLLGAQARTPSQLVDCSHYFTPDDEHEVDADGSVHDLDITNRDYPTGGGTINRVRALKPRYELKGAGAKVVAYYGAGATKSTGARFGTAVFGKAVFGSSTGATFIPIGEAGESDARDPARFRIGKKARFIRTRLKSSGPAAVCALRSVELTVRPSGATRR